MKTWITVLCAAVALLAGCAKEEDPEVEAPKVVVDGAELEEQDDLRYFEGVPFTGGQVIALAALPPG